jgi:predicted ferric reductase
MKSEMIWYVARASGVVTLGLLTASVLWGLVLSTRAFRAHPRPAWVLDLHRFLAGSAVIFLAVHVGSVLADTYVHFGPVNVLVPFTGDWHPTAVAWGIIAMYLLVTVEVTSLLRSHVPARAWRATHYAAFPLLGLSILHGLTAGTDRHSLWLRCGIFVAAAAVVGLLAVRARQASRAPAHVKVRAPRPGRAFS